METKFIFNYVVSDPDDTYDNIPKVIAINILNKPEVALITFLNTSILNMDKDDNFHYTDDIFYIIDNIEIPFEYFDLGLRDTYETTKSFYLVLYFDKDIYNQNKKYITDLLCNLHDKYTSNEYYCNWKKDYKALVNYIKKYNRLPRHKNKK